MKSIYEIKNTPPHQLNIAEIFYKNFQPIKTRILQEIIPYQERLIIDPTYSKLLRLIYEAEALREHILGFRLASAPIVVYEYGFQSVEYAALVQEFNNLNAELNQRVASAFDIVYPKRQS